MGITTGADRDRSRIDLEDQADLSFWTARLGVSRERLRQAVLTVGPIGTTVEAHLRTIVPLRIPAATAALRPDADPAP